LTIVRRANQVLGICAVYCTSRNKNSVAQVDRLAGKNIGTTRAI